MKKSSLRVAILGLLLVAATMSMTSCNKGYGCPTDFSLGSVASAVLPLK